MNHLQSLKRSVWTFILFFTVHFSFAQSWLELREQNANFKDIKAAFDKQYGTKIKKFKRELQEETTNGGVKSSNFERLMEGMVQYMRWADFFEPRVKESNGDLNALSTGMVQALADQSRRSVATRTNANWTLMGPKTTPTYGGNGRINAVRAHPSVAGTIFACSPAGGLWKSTNHGDSWLPITDAIAVLGATDVAFDPTNPNIMYLATGDGDAGDSFSTGIYKSTNGGSTWAATGLSFTSDLKKKFSKLLVNPTDGSILAGGSAGIYRSTDAGATWTQTATDLIRDLEFNPANPSIVYAGGYYGAGFFRSTNGGVTWTSSGAGLTASSAQRIALAVTPLDASYVYALVANISGYGFEGLYLSTDAGLTFSKQSSTPNILAWESNGSDSGGQGWYDLAIAVDPSVKTTIYTGGVNVWKSTNAGTTWTNLTHWAGSGAPYIHADNHDLIFIGSTLYAGNDGGVFSSENGGLTWSDRSSNLSIAQMYSFGISQTNPNLMISGHQDNGTNLTTDANTWWSVNGGDGMICFIDRADNTRTFSSIYYGKLYRSTGGSGFTPIYTVSSGAWVTPWLQDPVSPSTLYAAGAAVEKSTDYGTTWTNLGYPSGTTLYSLDVSKSNNQNIIAATRTAIYKTTNGGSSWSDITAGLPSATISILNIYFDPRDANKIYVGLASYAGQSVFYSANGGTSWTNISAGLPNVPANCFVLQTDNGDVYCGTDVGIYLKAANTASWVAFNTGLPGIPVRDLDIYVPTGKLRAATYARGIWESPLNLTNSPPSVSITSPANNAVFSNGANVTIDATAADTDGTIAKVEFYQGITLIGSSTTAPYTTTWANPAAGTYVLTTKVYDNLGATTTSSAVNITVTGSPYDIGISTITMPNGLTALQTVAPSVILKNFGTNTLTATTISYKIDNNAFANYAWTGTLTAGASVNVTLPNITGYSVASHTFTAQTGLVNGVADDNATNNAATVSFSLFLPPVCANSVNSPHRQDFNAATTIPTNWTNYYSWSVSPIHGNGTGNGLFKYVSLSGGQTQIDMLPVKILSTTDQLSFDYRLLQYAADANYPTAAAPMPTGWGKIEVQVSANCGINFTPFYTLTDSNHVVSKNWATKNIPLSNYTNQTLVFRFIVTMAQGDGYADFDNIVIASPCSGTPLTPTATVSAATSCINTPFTLSATGASGATGIRYQWQKSTDNGTTWNNLNAATSMSVTTPTVNTAQYKLVTTCANGNGTSSSNSVSSTAVTPIYATVPYTQTFESWATSSCVAVGATKDIPSVNWLNNPTLGINSWRRDDQGVSTSAWGNQFGAYAPTAQSGTYSARFHSYSTGLKGQIDLFINLSSSATKNLSFYYINTSGSDSLRVLFSTDAGQTFQQIGTSLNVVSGWTQQIFTLPAGTATSVIRFEAIGDNGYSDIGLDNLTVMPVTVVPNCIGSNVLPVSGSSDICPSSGLVLKWEAVAGASSYDVFTNLPNVPSPINVVGTSYTVADVLALNTNYTWQVVPKNSVGSAANCYIWSFTTKSEGCYCLPTYVDGCSDTVDVITRVRLGTLDNISGIICNATNYNYYNTATVPTLPRDIQQSLHISFGNDGTQFAGAWIDFNQNGVFETTEYIGGNEISPRNYGTSIVKFTIPNTALTGQTRLRLRGGEDSPLTADQSCGASSSTYGETEDYRVNIVASSPCTGVALTNTTLASTPSACVGESLVLSLQNTYTLKGITYQWQYTSTNGATWTDMSGETNTMVFTTVVAAYSYRCAVSCSGGAPTYSIPIAVALKTAVECYCTPAADCVAGFIDAVTITNTPFSNTASGCAALANSYTLFSAATTTTTFNQNANYTLNVTTSSPQIISMWLDLNQNGSFEASEWTQITPLSTANVAATTTFNVPKNASIGLTRMRLRSRTSGSANSSTDACTTFGSGETEDYLVTIAPAVIPVELTSISAVAEGANNRIDWATATERGLKTFIVERSLDNKQWFAVGSTAPKGGQKATSYTMLDNQPVLLGYYRLRSVDLNGSEQISKTVSVKRQEAKTLSFLSVAPVPTTEGVVVDFSIHKNAVVTLTLTNIMGQVIKQTLFTAQEGVNKTTLSLGDLPNGAYFLRLSDGVSTELKRVVKQ